MILKLKTRLKLNCFSFSTLSVALVLTHCWIVRLPCTDESETSPFTVELQGYSLENHVVASYEGMALDECKQTCYDDPRCRSINHSVNNRCEISNKINETANAGHLKAKSGHTYFSTNYRTKNVSLTFVSCFYHRCAVPLKN